MKSEGSFEVRRCSPCDVKCNGLRASSPNLKIWTFRTISVTLKWQWKGKGGGGTRTLPSVHYPPFFPHCPLKKGDRVGKPYPLFHDVKRARFAQRTSPSVLCRKEACMAGV